MIRCACIPCFAIIVVVLQTGCSSPSTEGHAAMLAQDTSAAKSRVKADTSTIAFLPYDTSYYWLFEEHAKCRNVDLSPAELDQLEELVQHAVADYMSKYEHPEELAGDSAYWNQYRIARSGYVLQCIAVINSKGEKEVWVNAMCHPERPSMANWRRSIYLVQDGGGCYYQLKVNLSKGTYSDLYVNGVA